MYEFGIVAATRPLTESPAVRQLLASLPNDVLLDMLVGAVLTVLSYSSLAIVLLTATLAGAGMLPAGVALGLVLGANVGSGLLGVLTTARADVATRRLPVGNLLFKLDNVLMTPHSAALTRECEMKVAIEAAQAVVDFAEGKEPINVFNRKDLKRT